MEGPDCYRCRYGLERDSCNAECFSAAEREFERHGDEVCAFVVEPMLQAAAGMRVYSPVYLQKLRQACDRCNIHLIADEIATGFGRTGRLFACEHAGISPDIICLSKGLTGGYLPMALVVTGDQIYDAFYADYNEGRAFMHSHTYSGNPLACAAATAVLAVLAKDKILAKARAHAGYFRRLVHDRLDEASHVGDIRGIGLINAVELVEDKNSKRPFAADRRTGYQIYRQALARGVILRPLGDVLYFNPPLTISRADMELAVDVCAAAIGAVLH